MTPKPQSRVSVDPNFEKRLREVKDHAAASASARLTGGQVRWLRPAGWAGDLFDVGAMAGPFSRVDVNRQFVEAVSDPAAPGTTGDIVAAVTQLEVLVCLERATIARHTMRRPRAAAVSLARQAAHGGPSGAVANMVEYARRVVRQSRASG